MNATMIITRQQLVADFFNGRWGRIDSLNENSKLNHASIEDIGFLKLVASLLPSRLLLEQKRFNDTSLFESHIHFHHSHCGACLVKSLSALAVNDEEKFVAHLTSFFSVFRLFLGKYAASIDALPISLDFNSFRTLELSLRQYALVFKKFYGRLLPSKITCVVGMHRSGTSALSGMLEASGLFGPKDSLGSTEHNPLGYWESTALVTLNDHFISQLGTHWSKIFMIDKGWYHTDLAQKWFSDYLDLLPVVFDVGQHILLKDPRLCVLIEAFLPFFGAGLVPTDYLLILRSPLEVIFSLEKSEGLDLCSALRLWIDSIFKSEYLTRYLPRRLFAYGSLLESPEVVLSSCYELWSSPLQVSAMNDSLRLIEPRFRRQSARELRSKFEDEHGELMPYLELANYMYEILLSGDTAEVHAQMNDLRDQWDVALSAIRH